MDLDIAAKQLPRLQGDEGIPEVRASLAVLVPAVDHLDLLPSAGEEGPPQVLPLPDLGHQTFRDRGIPRERHKPYPLLGGMVLIMGRYPTILPLRRGGLWPGHPEAPHIDDVLYTPAPPLKRQAYEATMTAPG